MTSDWAFQRKVLGVSALLFATSATVTIVWCASMSAMGGMPMPGGWTMSMAWMRMPGQTWPGAAASFLGMWIVMMVAMMLPSLVPMLWRYRQAVGKPGETSLGRLTALVGMGYFFVWTMFGMAAFPVGVALTTIEMQRPEVSRAVPIAVGVVVLMAGSLQFTAWKTRHLACCWLSRRMMRRARDQQIFGIIIRMFMEAGAAHHAPHFHTGFSARAPRASRPSGSGRPHGARSTDTALNAYLACAAVWLGTRQE